MTDVDMIEEPAATTISEDVQEVTITGEEHSDVYRFDSRKKILTRTIRKENKVKVGGNENAAHAVEVTTFTFDEDGIRSIVQELKLNNDNMAKQFASVNATLDATKHLVKDEELDQWLALHEKAQGYMQRKKAEESREYLLKNSKATREQYRAVLKAIGEHIKVE